MLVFTLRFFVRVAVLGVCCQRAYSCIVNVVYSPVSCVYYVCCMSCHIWACVCVCVCLFVACHHVRENYCEMIDFSFIIDVKRRKSKRRTEQKRQQQNRELCRVHSVSILLPATKGKNGKSADLLKERKKKKNTKENWGLGPLEFQSVASIR